jgi:phosphopantothenate--cysteine ligase
LEVEVGWSSRTVLENLVEFGFDFRQASLVTRELARDGEESSGMNIVVTGGSTIAPIDDVRHIANLSTGRFSAEITEALLRRGANVTHIHAPSALLPFDRSAKLDLRTKSVEQEFDRLTSLHREFEECQGRLQLRSIGTGRVRDYAEVLRAELVGRQVDAVFLAMAVSDFEPEPVTGKIESDCSELLLKLQPTPKVIRLVRDWSPATYLVGFKLLSGSNPNRLIETARAACQLNRADLTVANDLSSLRDGGHLVYLVGPEGLRESIGPGGPVATKLVVHAMEALRGSTP